MASVFLWLLRNICNNYFAEHWWRDGSEWIAHWKSIWKGSYLMSYLGNLSWYLFIHASREHNIIYGTISLTFKVTLSPFKKKDFVCFNEIPLQSMKNAFYFILKDLFVLKIFRFFVLTFWSYSKNGLIRKIRLIWNFMFHSLVKK